jgi:hypothetical protein
VDFILPSLTEASEGNGLVAEKLTGRNANRAHIQYTCPSERANSFLKIFSWKKKKKTLKPSRRKQKCPPSLMGSKQKLPHKISFAWNKTPFLTALKST